MGSFVTLNKQSLKTLLEACHNCAKGNIALVCIGNTLPERLGTTVLHPITFTCCGLIVSAEETVNIPMKWCSNVMFA
ncbi:hypothetical protein Pcinc_029170 [Petrolisthes cinctipes]|uniref:Uncharacterized protein n=1 Tax=Petrolisthes cinctipes TaxID=88211 RepID=A0AAE1K883_PETCI|nr:hypothetical protein Pcinc_029170 [Petrolisthes cinctipes]